MARPDYLNPVTRGWQNVAREISRRLDMVTDRPGDTPLHPVEHAERDAWQVAHDAVMGVLEARNERDGD